MKKINMRHVKTFESGSDFNVKKEELIQMLRSFYEFYYNFTKEVSPKNWRTTGHHLTQLRNMKEDIEKLESITPKDLENEWVRKQLED
jgi:hypothetical protein